jgi:hypothetical protein
MPNTEPTAAQIKKTAAVFSEIAGETVKVELVAGAYYALGSELATLRLWRGYNRVQFNSKTQQGYSENLKTWFFRLDR